MKGSVSPLDLSKLAPTPRGGGAITFRARSARKWEGLRVANSFDENVKNDVSKVIQNAIVTGQPYAIVQTMRIDSQYTYTFNSVNDEADCFVIHDLYTKLPIANVKAKVSFASAGRDLIQWLREQELDVIVCSRRVSENPIATQVPIADWVQLLVVFIPFKPIKTTTLSALFNSQYLDKDTTASTQWSERCLRAQSCGCPFFINSILYVGADYGIDGSIIVVDPLRHPDMSPLDPNPKWCLSERLVTMVAWVHSLGYTWTLAAPRVTSKWAYFVVLMDPISTYK